MILCNSSKFILSCLRHTQAKLGLQRSKSGKRLLRNQRKFNIDSFSLAFRVKVCKLLMCCKSLKVCLSVCSSVVRLIGWLFSCLVGWLVSWNGRSVGSSLLCVWVSCSEQSKGCWNERWTQVMSLNNQSAGASLFQSAQATSLVGLVLTLQQQQQQQQQEDGNDNVVHEKWLLSLLLLLLLLLMDHHWLRNYNAFNISSTRRSSAKLTPDELCAIS